MKLRLRSRTVAARRLSVGLLLIPVLALTACSAGTSMVTGEVAKRDRSALPPDAVVTVELRDVSLADAPAITLSSDVIGLDGRQLPVSYELAYDPDDIDERSTYTVFARIEASGSLIYISDTAYPVITNGAPTEDVEVVVVPTG